MILQKSLTKVVKIKCVIYVSLDQQNIYVEYDEKSDKMFFG